MKPNYSTTSILIVDDDKDDRWLMGQAFDQVCPQVQKVFACDGEEAEHWYNPHRISYLLSPI